MHDTRVSIDFQALLPVQRTAFWYWRGGEHVIEIQISQASRLDPFEFRWPDGVEAFETGWAYAAVINGEPHKLRHALGARPVYGRPRGAHRDLARRRSAG